MIKILQRLDSEPQKHILFCEPAFCLILILELGLFFIGDLVLEKCTWPKSEVTIVEGLPCTNKTQKEQKQLENQHKRIYSQLEHQISESIIALEKLCRLSQDMLLTSK